jgi:uncharacterized membrane protein
MALAVSLALNLAVGGFVLGHALSDGGPWRRGPHGSTVRDVGFGPMTEALNPADRTLLRDRLFARAPELREARRRTEADLAAQVAALSAQPFDEAALRAAFEAQHQHMAANLALAHEALIDFLVALPPEARLALAERLATRIGTAP